MAKSKKIAQIENLCVACGTCLRVCPLSAISITNGIKSKVDLEKCVGCGKCSKICPGSFIEIMPREVEHEN